MIDIYHQVKMKCKAYVVGALFEDTKHLFYSFSKKGEWIQINPRMYEFICKHKVIIEKLNYYELTAHADMSPLCDRFLRYVTPGGKIIDIGSGHGKDIKYFLSKGYEAEGIDASFELCRISNEHGLKVENITIRDQNPREFCDGIWANASLVYVSVKEIETFFVKAKSFLKKEGAIFASMKVGLQTDNNGRTSPETLLF